MSSAYFHQRRSFWDIQRKTKRCYASWRGSVDFKFSSQVKHIILATFSTSLWTLLMNNTRKHIRFFFFVSHYCYVNKQVVIVKHSAFSGPCWISLKISQIYDYSSNFEFNLVSIWYLFCMLLAWMHIFDHLSTLASRDLKHLDDRSMAIDDNQYITKSEK